MLVGSTTTARRGFLLLLGVVFVFCLVAALWYAGVAVGLIPRSTGPALLGYTSGSSTVGYWCGVAGFFIILFEMALALRKRWRRYKLLKARLWMWLHIWLGLACLPLAVAHSGMAYGGLVTGVLMILFMLVIGSGSWGLAMQQIIPRKLLDEIPAETIATERHVVLTQLLGEANALVDSVRSDEDLEEEEVATVVVNVKSGVYRATQLVRFYRSQIVPYLKAEGLGRGPLSTRGRAFNLFADLRRGSDPVLESTVNRLEAICETRRQLDRQYRLYYWLHNWLLVHLPLSIALTVVLFLHVGYALKYW